MIMKSVTIEEKSAIPFPETLQQENISLSSYNL